VKEPSPEAAPEAKKRTPFWESLKGLPQAYYPFLKVSLLFSLAYFSFSFFILRATGMGVTPADVLLLYTLYNVMYMLASVPVGILSDRIGRKPVIVGAFALYGLICIGFALWSTWWQATLLFALYGVFVAADDSVNKAYISDITPPEKRSTAMGAYNTATGVVYLPASLLVGALWAFAGPVVGFLVAGGIAIISVPAFLLFCRD
jgi:MFS family permease